MLFLYLKDKAEGFVLIGGGGSSGVPIRPALKSSYIFSSISLKV
jgi:hypothetical protein